MNAVNDRKLKREASQYFKFVHEQSQDQITALQCWESEQEKKRKENYVNFDWMDWICQLETIFWFYNLRIQ